MTTRPQPVLVTEGLDKSYGKHRALDKLTLTLPPGPVGLLGPNGAGKTTLLRLLLGLLRLDGGRARVVGLDPSKRSDRLAVRRVVGYMPEGDCLLPGVNAVELVSTLGQVTGLSRRDAMTRSHEALDYVGLEEQRYRTMDEYSTGMKQRVKLAQALVHDPELLLLDEPTNGLDPKGRRHMLELVSDLGHVQGKNVLLCSHLLPDVERTCDSVVIIHRGRVVETGSLEEMRAVDSRRVRVEVRETEAFSAVLEARNIEFESLPGGKLGVAVPESGEADELFGIAAGCGATIRSLEPVRSSLEDTFLRVLSDAEAS